MIKEYLFGVNSIDEQVKTVILRVGQCRLIRSILCNIEDIFSSVIFIEDFTEEALLQLIR